MIIRISNLKQENKKTDSTEYYLLYQYKIDCLFELKPKSIIVMVT